MNVTRQSVPREPGLAQVVERLDALIYIFLPPIPEGKQTDERRVLELCDYAHTREEIAEDIGKPFSTIDPILSSLRKAGRIRSVLRDGHKVYVRVAA